MIFIGGYFVKDGDNLFIVLLCAGVVCVLVILVDGWFFRPQRDPGATSVEEPMLPKMAGYALVLLSVVDAVAPVPL